MKISLLTHNWGHPWIELYRGVAEARGHTYAVNSPEADVFLHMWSDGGTQPVPEKKNIFFLRRFELFTGGIQRVNWKAVDHLICVNDWIAEQIRPKFSRVPVSVIYNAVDVDAWTYRERKPGTKIGMVCHVHPKKNLPLAAQILAALPPEYELHIAGEVQDPCTAAYLDHFGKQTERRIFLYGHVPRAQLDTWWEDKSYCLSTSISEGCPNNVLEAMAKGIKAVVHSWPGATDQFPLVFEDVGWGVRMIQDRYDSGRAYRGWVEERFGLRNLHRVIDIAEGLHAKA